MWDLFSVHKDSNKFAGCNTSNDSISCEGSSKKSYNAANLIDYLKKKHTENHSNFQLMPISGLPNIGVKTIVVKFMNLDYTCVTHGWHFYRTVIP